MNIRVCMCPRMRIRHPTSLHRIKITGSFTASTYANMGDQTGEADAHSTFALGFATTGTINMSLSATTDAGGSFFGGPNEYGESAASVEVTGYSLASGALMDNQEGTPDSEQPLANDLTFDDNKSLNTGTVQLGAGTYTISVILSSHYAEDEDYQSWGSAIGSSASFTLRLWDIGATYPAGIRIVADDSASVPLPPAAHVGSSTLALIGSAFWLRNRFRHVRGRAAVA